MAPKIVADLLRLQAEKDPERVAVVLDGVGQMTYAQWEAAASRLVRKLVGLGLKKGDRVALLFSNREAFAFMIGYFAVHKAGGIVVPINVRLTPTEIAYILTHSETAGVLAEGRFAANLAKARQEAPGVKWAVIRGEGPGEHRWEALTADGDDSPFQVEQGDEEVCDILYTSGTTGFPKGVACTHKDVVNLGGSGGLEKIFSGQCYLHAIPLFTFAGTHAMMLTPVKAGMTSVIQPKFDAGRFLELIAKHKVSLTYAVPSMIMLCLNHPAVGEHDYSSLKMIMYGTAPMPPEGVKKLSKIFPTTMLLNIYGLTEGGGAACSLPPHEAKKRPDSIGRPLPGTELKIVREDGAPAGANEVGEIWMRGQNRRRYFKNEEATQSTWTEEGWLKTGDLGYLDADGYLYISGRNKDMIIRGGYNVYPVEIEGVLHEHPAVLEAAVVGVPHEVLGEDIKACIVLRLGQKATAEEIQAFCKEKLADFKCPRQIEFLSELPRNALGKVLKRLLRQADGEDKSGAGLEVEASA